MEQLLNNQPLTTVSGAVTDLEALTPNHFLIGQTNVIWPICMFSGDNVSHRMLFREQTKLLITIWNQWVNEFCPTLQHRSKWSKEELNEHQIGDLVWIVDKDVSPFHYPLGRITELIKGSDNIARSATVKTVKGTYQRPLVKLIPVD